MWGEWWVWAAAALALGILELLAPAYVFLGFAVGGVVMALALLVGGACGGLDRGVVAAGAPRLRAGLGGGVDGAQGGARGARGLLPDRASRRQRRLTRAIAASAGARASLSAWMPRPFTSQDSPKASTVTTSSHSTGRAAAIAQR